MFLDFVYYTEQVAVLAGDFLLSRACVALASLKNTEVNVELFFEVMSRAFSYFFFICDKLQMRFLFAGGIITSYSSRASGHW